MKTSLRAASSAAIATGLLFGGGLAQASGFRVPEVTVSGLGTSNALVANDKELGALPYNPAAMSFHQGTNLVSGLVIIEPNTAVSNSTGSYESNPNSPFYLPNFYLMGHVTQDLTWGVGLNTPFGLQTQWAPGTFAFPGGLAVLQPTLSKVEMVNINPNVAYKLGDLSLAAGLDYYYVQDVNLNTVAADVNGDGSDFGYNLAALFKLGQWNFGASYRSAVAVEIEGKVNTTDVRANLDFPSIFQIGVRHQTTDKLAFEFDFDRTGWSTFDRIVISSAASGATLSTSTNNWEDANAYRFGGTYELGAATQLRFGYSFDETAQPDSNFNARVPDADRHLFSVGVGQKLGAWTLDAGYMYGRLEDRTVASTTAYASAAQDPNGTTAYNGTYETDIHLVGLGLSTKF